MKQNILFVHNNNDLYGAEVILLELLKRLDRERFRPIVVLPSDVAHLQRLSAELEKSGIEYRYARLGVLRRKYCKPLKIAQFLFDLAVGTATLVGLIVQRRVALVHSNTVAVTAGAFAAWLTHRPHIWHVHEIIVEPVVMRRLIHWLLPRLSTTVVCVSDAVRRHIAADQPAKAGRLQVIRNGIDLDRFRGGDGRNVRQEFRAGPSNPLVGMIGKVTRWKGQPVFAAAAARVLQRFPEARFAAVGGVFDDEVQFLNELHQQVEDLGISAYFQVCDFRKDIANVLDAFDIFVLPSTQPDPFPTVVLEAMSAGKPVIATAHGGPCEMVVPGETGLLVAPHSSAALAGAIEELLQDRPRALAMGAAGQRRTRELYDVRRFLAEFEALYCSLTGVAVPERSGPMLPDGVSRKEVKSNA